MHPIPHGPERMAAYQIAADQSAGLEGRPQESPRTGPAGWGSNLGGAGRWVWFCYSRSANQPVAHLLVSFARQGAVA